MQFIAVKKGKRWEGIEEFDNDSKRKETKRETQTGRFAPLNKPFQSKLNFLICFSEDLLFFPQNRSNEKIENSHLQKI